MAPRFIIRKYHENNSLRNNYLVKKLHRSSITINQLRKKIAHLTSQNKELSTTRNNVLLHKLSLENEINTVKNTNVQLTAMHRTVSSKLGVLEQTLQKCVPALVTMSQCVPSMLENVHEMSKLDKLDELKNKQIKEKQIKSVMPMVNGMTIIQPKISLRRCDMSPIRESSPSLENTPKRPRKSSIKNSPNLEPYVRLKDVAVMLKNSKSVSNETKPKCQIDNNLGEGPSWLFNNDNGTQSSENNDIVTDRPNNPLILNDMPMSTINEISTSSEVQVNLSTASRTSYTFNETSVHHSVMSPIESDILKNVTCRRRQKRSSGNSSITSDVDVSNVSTRSRRSATPKVNYKTSLKVKLRREK